MDKKAKIALLTALFVAAILIVSLAMAGPKAPKAKKACNDKADNDGDGYIDFPSDPGCSNKNDNSELDPNIECDDGADNDGDSAIDYNDAGCSGPTDNDETNCGDAVCEGGEVCDVCVADCGHCDSCNDTDGGNVITVFGTTSGYYNEQPYSNDDYCVDSGNIMEYYCSGEYEQSQQQSCGSDGYGPDYCNDSSVYRDYTDYFCTSGECDLTVTPEFVESCEYGCLDGTCNPIPDSCSDTDGGYVPEVQGMVSGHLNESYYEDTDYCFDNDEVIEYYCAGAYAQSEKSLCYGEGNQTGVCANGACA